MGRYGAQEGEQTGRLHVDGSLGVLGYAASGERRQLGADEWKRID